MIIEDFLINCSLSKKLFVSTLLDEPWVIEDNEHAENLYKGFLNKENIEALSVQFKSERNLNVFAKEFKKKLIETSSEKDYQELSDLVNKIYLDSHGIKGKSSIVTFNKVILTNDIKLDLEFLEKDSKMNNYLINKVLEFNNGYKYTTSTKNRMRKMSNHQRIVFTDAFLNNELNIMQDVDKARFIIKITKDDKEILEFYPKFPYLEKILNTDQNSYIENNQDDFALVVWDKIKFKKYFEYECVRNNINIDAQNTLQKIISNIYIHEYKPFKDLRLLDSDFEKLIFKFNIPKGKIKEEMIESFNKLVTEAISEVLNQQPDNLKRNNNTIELIINSALLKHKLEDKKQSTNTVRRKI